MPSRKKKNQKPSINAAAEWIRIRRQLFRRTLIQVQKLLGEDSAKLKSYRRSYEKEAESTWKVSSQKELLRKLKSASCVLIGDFHALRQAQRTQLRILQAIGTQDLVLAVECIPWVQQEVLDQWLQGELTDLEFLKNSRWSEDWGFPWENYKPLLEWARDQGVPVYGINKVYRRRDAHTLEMRDHFSAQALVEIRGRHPEALIVVSYGDLHLGSKHLPRQISMRSPAEKILRVFQNSEKIYFEMMARGLDLKCDVVRMKDDLYCVQSMTPWVKWQNYLNYLEAHVDNDWDDEGPSDHTDQIEQYIGVLSKEFHLSAQQGSMETFGPSDVASGAKMWSRIKKRVDRGFIGTYLGWIESGESFYIPELSVGYLARPTVNHVARLAMSALYAQVSGWQKYPRLRAEEFSRNIFLEGILYFGEKLINPRKKTDTLVDLKKSLTLKYTSAQTREVLQLALSQKMTEVGPLRGSSRKHLFRPRRSRSYWEAARLLGGMMGEKLYDLYRQGKISGSEVQSLLQLDLGREDFDLHYGELVAILARYPDPFLSKREKL